MARGLETGSVLLLFCVCFAYSLDFIASEDTLSTYEGLLSAKSWSKKENIFYFILF
jgi:hypothetical protein